MSVPHGDKRNFLLTKALEIYEQKGDITMRELSVASGMNLASVNYYFGGKDKLVEAVERRLIGDLNDAALSAAAETRGAPEEVLTSLIRTLVQFLLERPGFLRYFYELAGSGSDNNYYLLSQIINTGGEFIRLVYRMITQETGITDPEQLLCRYLLLIASLIPPFMMGIQEKGTLKRLTELADRSGLPSLADSSLPVAEHPLLKSYIGTVVHAVLAKPEA